MPPSVSSENTTPNPNVSPAMFRSQTSISWFGLSSFTSVARYSPAGPPPMIAMLSAGFETLALPQPESLQLAGGRARQLADKFDRPRIFVRSDLALDEILQRPLRLGAELGTGPQHHDGLDDHASLLVRGADHRHLGDVGMAEQRLLDLRPGDVVAGADDHVVGPRLVGEVAVPVAHVDVAGDVPPVHHVGALAVTPQVAA